MLVRPLQKRRISYGTERKNVGASTDRWNFGNLSSEANKFGVNPFTAVVISGILLYPDLTQLMEKGNTVHFLGFGLRGVTYHSSVIPIIMATGFLYFVEKALEKVVPELIKGFMIPLISIIVVGFVTLAVFGPIGAVIGDVLAAAYENVYGLSPLIAGASKASALSFAFPSIATIPVFFGKGFSLFLLSCLLGFVIAFVTTMVLKFDADLSTEAQTK